jgi:hypothetical protein
VEHELEGAEGLPRRQRRQRQLEQRRVPGLAAEHADRRGAGRYGLGEVAVGGHEDGDAVAQAEERGELLDLAAADLRHADEPRDEAGRGRREAVAEHRWRDLRDRVGEVGLAGDHRRLLDRLGVAGSGAQRQAGQDSRAEHAEPPQGPPSATHPGAS